MGRDFTDLKDGDQIEPFHFNQVYAELRRIRKLKGVDRVLVAGMTDGQSVPTIEVYHPPLGYVGVAGNGGISASINSVVGTGTVQILQANGTTLQNAQILALSVYNPARDTANGTMLGSIEEGKRVWIQQDGFGNWYVAPLECNEP